MRPLHQTAICSSASFYLHYKKWSGHILTFSEIFCTFLNADKHSPASNARSTKRWMACFTPSNPLRSWCHCQAKQRILPVCLFAQQDRWCLFVYLYYSPLLFVRFSYFYRFFLFFIGWIIQYFPFIYNSTCKKGTSRHALESFQKYIKTPEMHRIRRIISGVSFFFYYLF